MGSSLVGKQCSLQFLKGEPTEIPAKGKPTVVELFATWCGPCRQVFPHLSEIARKNAAHGLAVVGVSLEPVSPELQAFVQQQANKMEYAVAADRDGRVGQELMQAAGVSGIPCALVVDRQGIVRFCGHPADPAFEAAVRQACAQTAPEPAAQQRPALETRSREQLAAAPIRELKALLVLHGVSAAGAAEKGDLVDLVLAKCC
ncbi:hypothetical protein WJX81_005679 [Elliptochloris bilobata]|uniref:Thioredoxin domain-containing protein n=1 Tax=Elliptochloris bilobata TaxID=381761 RepID=A0AAW1R2J9_9CHLO